MLALIPLGISLFVLSFFDSDFTPAIYITIAIPIMIGFAAGLWQGLERRVRLATFFLLAVALYVYGVQVMIAALALLIGVVFTGLALGMLFALRKPIRELGSTGSIMIIAAPFPLILGIYYLAIAYQSFGWDRWLGLSKYFSIFA